MVILLNTNLIDIKCIINAGHLHCFLRLLYIKIIIPTCVSKHLLYLKRYVNAVVWTDVLSQLLRRGYTKETRRWWFLVNFCMSENSHSSFRIGSNTKPSKRSDSCTYSRVSRLNPYPTAFPYGNGMVLHFYQQQESSTTKTVHKVINKGLKTYV